MAIKAHLHYMKDTTSEDAARVLFHPCSVNGVYVVHEHDNRNFDFYMQNCHNYLFFLELMFLPAPTLTLPAPPVLLPLKIPGK